MRTLLVATSAYFGLVFGSGFLLGVVRVLLLLPILGERAAELIEAPIMLVAIVFSARFVVGRILAGSALPALPARLAIGFAALAALLVVEFTVVLWLRDLSIRQYLAERDPIAGAVYVASLSFFALAPAILGARMDRSDERSGL